MSSMEAERRNDLRGKEELRLGVKYLLATSEEGEWQYGCFIQFICFKLFCFKFFCPFRQQNNSRTSFREEALLKLTVTANRLQRCVFLCGEWAWWS